MKSPLVRPREARSSRTLRPAVWALEERALLAPVNVLVNNPALDDPANGQLTQSETATLLFGNNVLIGYNDSGEFGRGNGRHFTGYSLSTDGGQTFSDLGRLPDTPNGDVGDPVLARDNTTGRIYLSTLMFTGAGTQIFRSDDGGATFPNRVNGMPGFSANDFLDRHWIAVDNFPGPGQGNVYELARNFAENGSPRAPGLWFSRSTNGATTDFTDLQLIAHEGGGNVQGANVQVGTDHSVYTFYFDERTSPEAIRVRRSTDQGLTFGPEITVATLSTGPGFNGDLGLEFRSNAFPQVAVNPVNGAIYVVYNDNPPGADRADVYFTQSLDNGATWSPPVRVNRDATTSDQWQPAVAVTPDGSRVGVFWYDRRNDPSNVLTDYFGRVGVVSGGTVGFGNELRVTTESFRPVFGQDPVVNPTYMGDYDTAAADNGFFHVTWGDGRLGNNDVRAARVATTVQGPEVLNASLNINNGQFSTALVTFNQSIYLRSVDAGDFLLTGPGGSVPVAGIAPVAGRPDQVLVTFPTQGPGNYSLTVGPNIQNRSLVPMDNDLDGTAGEGLDDRFVSSFTVVSFISYQVSAAPFEPIDLAPGQPGVFTILDPVDDGSGLVNLGTSTFTFYGVQYTELYVSSNGLITFVSPNNNLSNQDLISQPPQAAIAPLWDDWFPDASPMILGRVDGLGDGDPNNDRLIIEWNDVENFSGSQNLTWQAILQLNNATGQSTITFNYVDVDAEPGIGNGASATIGIKNAGTQGPERVLYSFNQPSVGSGTAIRFTSDQDAAPTAIAAQQGVAPAGSGAAPAAKSAAAVVVPSPVLPDRWTAPITLPALYRGAAAPAASKPVAAKVGRTSAGPPPVVIVVVPLVGTPATAAVPSAGVTDLILVSAEGSLLPPTGAKRLRALATR